jgi:hypothetical protein
VLTRVVNASPVIFLAKLGRLEILRLGADRVFVPRGVLAEVQAKQDDAHRAVSSLLGSWLAECVVRESKRLPPLSDIGPGEREVLSQALELGAEEVVLDDLRARQAAASLNLGVVGTLGLLLAARKRGILQQLRPELAAIKAAGFRIAPALEREVLREAGE